MMYGVRRTNLTNMLEALRCLHLGGVNQCGEKGTLGKRNAYYATKTNWELGKGGGDCARKRVYSL